jgi:hypothetical protein
MKRNRIVLLLLGATTLCLAACAGKATPAPGAIFAGRIDMGDSADSDDISFKVSEESAAIINLSITVTGLKCDALTAGRVSEYLDEPSISISKGSFSASIPTLGRVVEDYNLGKPPSEFPVVEDLDTAGQIEGIFSSPTKASGTITLYMWLVMTDRACELGTFSWQAEAPRAFEKS